MAEITLKGNPVSTAGEILQTGERAPDFKLTDSNMADRHLSDFQGKRVVLNIFPSIDTSTCATSVRKFNEKAAGLDNTVVLNISRDLPFAQKRFCAAEGLEGVETLSEFKDHDFSDNYKVLMTSGPLAGLMSRVVVVVAENGHVIHSEQVPEIVDEPNYEAALNSLK